MFMVLQSLAGKSEFGDRLAKAKAFARSRSSFPCLFSEIAAFAYLEHYVRVVAGGYSQGELWAPYVRYAFDPNNRAISNVSRRFFERRILPYQALPEPFGIPENTGRLCASCTGDGKRRVFAVGNYINQRLLYPIHQWLAEILRLIPMDGTFDQTAPLDRLSGVDGCVYSIDLKAATDRWPLLWMIDVFTVLFGHPFAASAVGAALGSNVFEASFVRKSKDICFVTGQPPGYSSSWPLFALSHHMVIWYAAELCYPGRKFDRYAVLGDDVVIADDRVASRYSELLLLIGVTVSVGKSLTSPTGACEFAKRFRIRRMTVDVSPVSIKKVLTAQNPLGWYNFMLSHPKQLRLSTQLRLAGFGFKAASRPGHASTHGRRCRRLLIMRLCGILPSTLWLSVSLGRWIRPEIVGAIVDRLRDHFLHNCLLRKSFFTLLSQTLMNGLFIRVG